MNIRQRLAEIACELKEEKGLSYEDFRANSSLTNKQISCILSGRKGVSIDKIEEVFTNVFEEDLVIVLSRNLN